MAVDVFKLSGTVEVDTGKASANLKRVDSAARQTQSHLDRTGSAAKKAGGDIAGGLDRGQSSARQLISAINSLHAKLGSLKSPNLNFGGGSSGGGLLGSIGNIAGGNLLSGAITSAISGVGGALKDAWKAGIEMNKQLETASVRFSRFFGNNIKEADAFRDVIAKFAKDSPIFELPEALTGAQRLLQMKIAAKDIPAALANIADAVGGVGGNAQTIDSVTRALSQMVGTGRIQADEMNQLTEANIPAWELLAKAIGKTEAETRKLVEQGRVGAGAVQGIIAMMGETFAGQSALAGNTLAGLESQFDSALQERLSQATKKNFEQLKNAYAKGTEGFASGAAGDFAKEIDGLLGALGDDATGVLNDLASGKYFAQGADAIIKGRQAKDAYSKGETGKALNLGAQAVGRGIGLEYGAKGEDRVADFVAKQLSGDGIDKKVFGVIVQGITAALQAVEPFAKKAAETVGMKTGEGVKEGTQDSLQMKSPSRVMIALGKTASESFADGFEQGKKAIQPITFEDLIQKQYDRADAKGYIEMIKRVSKERGVDPALGLGIASRETGIRNIIGDRGRGAGLMQVDIGTDAAFKASGAWKDAEASFRRGLDIFEEKLRSLQTMAGKTMSVGGHKFTVPKLEGDQLTQTALAMFNSGWWAPYHVSKGRSPDFGTTGGDYSADVLQRADVFRSLLSQSSQSLTQFTAILPQAIEELKKLAGLAIGGDGASAQPFRGQIVATANLGSITTTANLGAVPLAEIPEAIKNLKLEAPKLATAVDATSAAMTVAKSRAGEWAKDISAVSSATKEAVDHFAHFKDALASGFDDLLEGRSGFKDFGKSLLKGLGGSLISQATGGKASTPGQLLSGLLTGGFAGGNPAAAALGGGAASGGGGLGGAINTAQNIGGLFKKGGLLSKLPGVGKLGGFLGKIPGLGKLGSLFGFGGGGAAGGASAGAGGATGAAALFSNPFTAILGGALFAAPFIAKLFGKNPLDDYRKLIKGEYGLDVRSKTILGKVMQIGQSKYGEEWQKRKIETVRLPEVRDMLSEYSQGFGKAANSKLFDSRIFGDAFSSVNQFKVGLRALGGPVTAGAPYIVGERRPELFIPNQSGRILPSLPDNERGGRGIISREMVKAMLRAAEAMQRLEARIDSMPAEHVVTTGLERRPGAATKAVRQSFELRDEHARAIGDLTLTR